MTTSSNDHIRKCPICKTAMDKDNLSSSFCSDRCRLIDLQKWFDGDYAIPGLPATEEDDGLLH